MTVLTYSFVLAGRSHVVLYTVKFIVPITIPDLYVTIIISFLAQEKYSVTRSERWKKISFRLNSRLYTQKNDYGYLLHTVTILLFLWRLPIMTKTIIVMVMLLASPQCYFCLCRRHPGCWQGHPCLTGFWTLGWCWGLGLTSSPRKNSVVTKLREEGGHGSETGRRAVEDKSCYDALKSATTSSSKFLSSLQQVILPYS